VLVEARVLDRQQRLLHQVGGIFDRDEVAVLLAEFADQDIVGRVDAQRDLGPVVGDGVERRHVRQHAEQDEPATPAMSRTMAARMKKMKPRRRNGAQGGWG
jgi:hypothetical protein